MKHCMVPLTFVIVLFAQTTAAKQNPMASDQLSRLPLNAQTSISGAIGRDNAQYRLQSSGMGFHAANVRQNLEVDFSSERVSLSSKNTNWTMALVAYGYGNALSPVRPCSPQATLNRAEYARGPLTEWYVNGPLGLEQGFTLRKSPGPSDRKPLTFALAVTGNVRLAATRQSEKLTFRDREGKPVLRYSGLAAYDATGRSLPSFLEFRDGELLLHVSVQNARYPITIDPVVQLAELTASDGAPNDAFGLAVAIAGNTAVVGAPNATIGANAQQGAAYVFVKPASGWTTTSTYNAKLTASDGQAGDSLGASVAISGNTIAIGACSQTGVCNNNRAGIAYVFVKPASGWSGNLDQTAELTASDGVPTDGFGDSIGVSGGTVVVGAAQSNGTTSYGPGKAYVFVRPASGWTNATETAQLTASDGKTGDAFFAISVASAGRIIFVGAPGATVGANAGQGAAYIFTKPSTGWKTTSRFKAKLTASDGAAGDSFGFCQNSLCITPDGTTVLVGANQFANGGKGKAYIFLRPTTGWATTSAYNAELTASDGVAGDAFGWSVAITDNIAAVGAVVGNSGTGAAYVFVKPSSGWATTSHFNAKLTASDGAVGDDFGFSTSITGNTVFVGALAHNSNQGSAYVYGP